MTVTMTEADELELVRQLLADLPSELPFVDAGHPELGDGQTLVDLDDTPRLAAGPRTGTGEFAPRTLSAVWTTVLKAVPSAEKSGIVGDQNHYSGYHRSAKVLRNAGKGRDYSLIAPADNRGDANACCAIDTKMSTKDMILVTGRLMRACQANDPRIEGVREFFGTLDGKRVTGWNRYQSSSARPVGYVTSDSSHLWHIHVSMFRDSADDSAACQGLADVMAGVPSTVAPPTPTAPTEETEPVPEIMPSRTYKPDGFKLKADGSWRQLPLNLKGDLSYGTGPGTWSVLAHVAVTDAPENTRVVAQLVAYDRDDKGKGELVFVGVIGQAELRGKGAGTFQVAALRKVGDTKLAGRTRVFRIRAKSNAVVTVAGLTVDASVIRQGK